jgi:hypothetical protein
MREMSHMKWYVFHDDDYFENGGIGLREFDSQHEAIAFIDTRLQSIRSAGKLENYTLIHGEQLQLTVVQRISQVAVKDP